MTTFSASLPSARAFRLLLVVLALTLAVAALISPSASAQANLPAAPAATIIVTNLNDSGPGSLRQAIADASSGDTITFNLSGTIYLDNTLNVDDAVTIDGSGQTVAVSGDSGNNGSPDVTVFEIFSGGALTLIHMNVIDGQSPPADDGGGAYVDVGGALTVQDSTFTGNSSTRDGAAIENGGTLIINNSTISGNSAGDDGGAIYNEGSLTITNSTIDGNTAQTNGGAIYNTATGSLNITDSTIDGNTSVGNGGGLYSTGSMTVERSTISGNSSTGNSPVAGAGGGITSWGTLTVINSTISGNTAATQGGGIISADGTASLSSSTVTLNHAGDSGGGIRGQTEISLQNTIVAGNTASSSGPDLIGTTTSSDYNLIGDLSDATFTPQAHDITGVDPLLGPLANNGGPTWTHALLAGSSAIDAGDTALTTDQRGITRPQGAVDDIGAFERASLRFTIEAPTVQVSQVTACTDLRLETFDGFSTGSRASLISTEMGTYAAQGTFDIYDQAETGGADDPSSSTPRFPSIFPGRDVTLTLDSTLYPDGAGYFGFWWSAGDGNNAIDITRADGSVETFTTQSILNSPALQGSPNCADAGGATCHFGNPTAAFKGQLPEEVFVYVNIFAQDDASRIKSVRFQSAGVANFESDNHTACAELIQNQGGADLGGIIIKKVTIPGNSTSFDFTDTIQAPNAFSLSNGQQQAFLNVSPGMYTVTEQPNTGSFQLRLLSCVDGDPNGIPSTGDVPSGTATINVDQNETVTCTFTNSDQPLGVTLASFDAAAQADHVLVTWETVSELENTGFNLYRTVTADPPTAADLLVYAPSQGPGSAQGFLYNYQDNGVTVGETYWYWLEDVDFNGATTLHGPVSVVFVGPTAVTLSGLEAAGQQPVTPVWPWLAALVAAALAGAGLVWRRRSAAA